MADTKELREPEEVCIRCGQGGELIAMTNGEITEHIHVECALSQLEAD